MKQIIFSIIIPHKNIPDLLQRCLNSIPRRDDIQIIVVDDNSDGNIVDFNNFPGLDEKYVETYFTKEGKGAGYARNAGLKYAKGKWLLFADADDFFNKGFVKKCDEYKNTDYDIIYFNTNSVESDSLNPVNNRLVYLENWLQNKDLDSLRYRSAVPYGKMIRRDLIIKKQIRFNEIEVANDVWFSCQIGYFAQKVTVDIYPIYCATVRNNSLYYHVTTKRRIIRFNECLRVNAFLYTIKKRKYREEPLSYYIPSLFHLNDILSFKFLYKYIQQENIIRVLYYLVKYVFYKLILKIKF
ncbi:MAG: glycosyltransferase [Bacteroidales bacterium]|jgi:glycosyltransferase involved in cell wall biosynthesis|nr:glycosyltransferase [Bacteroidales bacterium]